MNQPTPAELATNDDETIARHYPASTIAVDDIVSAGTPYTTEWDRGTVVCIHGGQAQVAWRGGCDRTVMSIELLDVWDGVDRWWRDDDEISG